MSKIAKWSAIKVYWVDSMRGNEWEHLTEAEMEARDKEIEQISVGLYFGETDRVLTLCSSYSHNQEPAGVLGVIGIPLVAITKVEVLQKPAKRKGIR